MTVTPAPDPPSLYVGSALAKLNTIVARLISVVLLALIASFALVASKASTVGTVWAFVILILLVLPGLAVRRFFTLPSSPLTDQNIKTLMQTKDGEGRDVIAKYLFAINAEGREPCREEFERIKAYQRSLRRLWLSGERLCQG